jgi:KUP system potassium uptake protein
MQNPKSSRLALAAIGVVFGDIGTSPLYTLRQCLTGEHAAAPSHATILGVLSLIFWALTLVVSVKYLTVVMRADNHGEGGILALLALVPERIKPRPHARVGWVALLVIAGAALLFGDGMITPAISVLSAMEGIAVDAPHLQVIVLPLTCLILLGLFAIQRHGTGAVGALFGPVMVVWFTVIGALGLWQIVHYPAVLQALSPVWAVRYFLATGPRGFWILGAVVLAVTGGEALYADMGHFGKSPIRRAWLMLVMPALVLSYFGQGALVIRDPAALSNPFFSMVPDGACTYLLVGLSGLATIIASQALISGAFSLTQQAVQLGFFPRMMVKHTSHETEGQIYVPAMNTLLAIVCIALVLVFRQSDRLAAAYGIAVSGTMAITSIVFFVVSREAWHWRLWQSLLVLLFFLAFDIPFFVANLSKFFEGGYVPLLIGILFFAVMINWRFGRTLFDEYASAHTPDLADFKILVSATTRVEGTAIFVAPQRTGVPPVMAHHLERSHALQRHVVILTIAYGHQPHVSDDERLEITQVAHDVYRVVAHVGYSQETHVPELLEAAAARIDMPLDLAHATYYISRVHFLGGAGGRMGALAEKLFSFVSRNAASATTYFHIPHQQVVELGIQLDL